MKILVDNKLREVELLSKEDNNLQVAANGKTYDIDVVMSENGFCSIICDGRSYNAESVKHANGNYTITTNFRNFDIELFNTHRNIRKSSDSDNVLQSNMTSPMPGKIIKVCVELGSQVKKGDALFVVEAMKMQNTYMATRDGEIAEILVKEGDAVAKDQALLSFK
ncbi:MAG: putative acetyl-CoA carboxylase [Bacteroidetes bacterium]|nr:putative acetyl-CoA carboxylase [Bacteroidota bacterium]